MRRLRTGLLAGVVGVQSFVERSRELLIRRGPGFQVFPKGCRLSHSRRAAPGQHDAPDGRAGAARSIIEPPVEVLTPRLRARTVCIADSSLCPSPTNNRTSRKATLASLMRSPGSLLGSLKQAQSQVCVPVQLLSAGGEGGKPFTQHPLSVELGHQGRSLGGTLLEVPLHQALAGGVQARRVHGGSMPEQGCRLGQTAAIGHELGRLHELISEIARDRAESKVLGRS